jgi:hypothetical protein
MLSGGREHIARGKPRRGRARAARRGCRVGVRAPRSLRPRLLPRARHPSARRLFDVRRARGLRSWAGRGGAGRGGGLRG